MVYERAVLSPPSQQQQRSMIEHFMLMIAPLRVSSSALR
jgi:hypothetical protein